MWCRRTENPVQRRDRLRSRARAAASPSGPPTAFRVAGTTPEWLICAKNRASPADALVACQFSGTQSTSPAGMAAPGEVVPANTPLM